jgi:ABC-type nickel/cobalt efflux system permease component RcnA
MKQIIKFLNWLVKTNIGRLALLFVLTLTFSLLNDVYSWAFYPAVIFAISLFIYVLILVIYAWIMTLLDIQQNRKKK